MKFTSLQDQIVQAQIILSHIIKRTWAGMRIVIAQ